MRTHCLHWGCHSRCRRCRAGGCPADRLCRAAACACLPVLKPKARPTPRPPLVGSVPGHHDCGADAEPHRGGGHPGGGDRAAGAWAAALARSNGSPVPCLASLGAMGCRLASGARLAATAGLLMVPPNGCLTGSRPPSHAAARSQPTASWRRRRRSSCNGYIKPATSDTVRAPAAAPGPYRPRRMRLYQRALRPARPPAPPRCPCRPCSGRACPPTHTS